MTLDGLLTLFGLLAAVVAVMSPVARLRLRVGLLAQVLVGVPVMGFVLYLEFFDLLNQPCRLASERVCAALTFYPASPLKPSAVAFLVVLIWILVAGLIHGLARPSPRDLSMLRRVVDELAQARRFGELTAFSAPYLPLLGRAADRGLALQRLHDRIAGWRGMPGGWAAILKGDKGTGSPATAAVGALKRRLAWLARIVPAQIRAEDAAGDVVRVLYGDPDLQRFLVEMRPGFGLALLRVPIRARFEFSDAFLEGLISRPGSALYVELERNLNLSGLRRYAIPDTNPLLHTLFADIVLADQLYVWRPVGNHLLRILRPGADDTYRKRLNRTHDDYDKDRWRDPVHAGILFFDIMVKEAAFQDHEYHMWLTYLEMVVEELAKAYDPEAEGVDAEAEFPTFGCRLIYDAFNAVGDWVALIENLPAGSRHRQVSAGLDLDDGRIPKMAAFSLARSLRAVLASDDLPEKFRNYMTEVAVGDVKALSKTGDGGRMRTALIRILIAGGDDSDPQHAVRLREAFLELDPVLRGYVEDLAAALDEVGPIWP